MEKTDQPAVIGRLTLGAIGALAGICLWLLVDVLPDRMADTQRGLLVLAAFYGTFFTALLALIGPLSVGRAGRAAVVQALGVALLVVWASTRFDDVEKFVMTPDAWVAALVLTLVPLPFFISRAQTGRWADYPVLFAQSWNIVVRYAAAWVFVGAVWGVVLLSDALLQLVGIDLIERLLDVAAVPYLLSGAALGVALAVVNELSDYVSPYLVLRLLRLLLPVVLVVVTIFLVALPFRGLSHLFGAFSASATLLAMAMGATTLITTALDADDTCAVQSPPMRVAVRLMTLLLPALAVLAGVAIWMRVGQYGWTPDRLAAATLTALVLSYGLLFAGSVLLGRDWGARIRRANTMMALVVTATATAWLTPLLNPQRIATASQIARFADGRTDAPDLDLWTMAHAWGRPGQAGLAQLAAMTDHPGAAALSEQLNNLEEASSHRAFAEGARAADRADRRASLKMLLPVLPAGTALPEALLESFRLWELDDMIADCARRTPQGNPGCALLLIDLSEASAGREAVLARLSPQGTLQLDAYFANANGQGYDPRHPQILKGGSFVSNGGATLDRLFDGDYRLMPVPAQILELGSRQIFFGP